MADSLRRPQLSPQTLGRRRLNLEQLDDRITPVVVAVNDFYEAEVGTVLNVTADRGVLINDQSLTNRGNDLVADLKSNPAYVNGTGPPGATAGIVVTKSGEIAYYCSIHGTPKNGQNGIIKVVS